MSLVGEVRHLYLEEEEAGKRVVKKKRKHRKDSLTKKESEEIEEDRWIHFNTYPELFEKVLRISDRK